MDVPVLCLGINELDTGARRNDKVVGGFRNVATVMEPIGIDIWRELFLDLASVQIAACEDTAIFARGQRRAPHEALHDHQVLWRLIARVRMLGGPKLFTICCIDTKHLAIATGIQHNIFVNHQSRAEVEVELIATRDGFGLPNAVAGRLLETDQFLSIVKTEIVLVSSQSERGDLGLLGPELLAD